MRKYALSNHEYPFKMCCVLQCDYLCDSPSSVSGRNVSKLYRISSNASSSSMEAMRKEAVQLRLGHWTEYFLQTPSHSTSRRALPRSQVRMLRKDICHSARSQKVLLWRIQFWSAAERKLTEEIVTTHNVLEHILRFFYCGLKIKRIVRSVRCKIVAIAV